MENVCDICGQTRYVYLFTGQNKKDGKKESHICFDCIVEGAGFSCAEAECEVSAAFSVIRGIDRVDEDGAELPM